MKNLTDKAFWANHWITRELKPELDLNLSYDRCFHKYFSKTLSVVPLGSSLIDIGCAPGRWLAYFSKKFGFVVSGVDYSDVGVQQTLENLKLLSVKAQVYHVDFFKFKSRKKYNVVLSLGFIEHFDNPDLVISRHLDLLRDGGLLVLMVPNFKGVSGFLQHHYWDTCLQKHNPVVMDPSFFHRIAAKFNLEVIDCSYVGSFEPALAVKPPHPTVLQNILIRVPLLIMREIRRLDFFDDINHPFFSGFIFCILRKRSR